MKKRYKKSYTFFKLIIFLLLTATIVVSFTLSRYKSNVTTNATATIALMANNAEVSINAVGKPGKTDKYPITITNFENNKVCEVTETFKINVSTTDNLPLNIKLYKDQNYTQEISKNSDGDFEDKDSFKFTRSTKETKTYYLKIEWPENQKNYTYSNEIDNIKVNAIITQIL